MLVSVQVAARANPALEPVLLAQKARGAVGDRAGYGRRIPRKRSSNDNIVFHRIIDSPNAVIARRVKLPPSDIPSARSSKGCHQESRARNQKHFVCRPTNFVWKEDLCKRFGETQTQVPKRCGFMETILDGMPIHV